VGNEYICRTPNHNIVRNTVIPGAVEGSHRTSFKVLLGIPRFEPD